MSLYIYNTLTQQKEEFKPLKNKVVNMYVCGVTPYDEVHLGHARCYVAFDVVRRYLEYKGYTVNYVQNFTDIDDKIIKRAQEKNVPPLELAQKNIDAYFQDINALNIKPALKYPRVTEYIPDIVKIVEKLVNSGHAYVVDGDVYFRVASFPGYGKLSKRELDQLKSGARVDVDERKESPLDFALWKKEKPGEPSWPSPWGNGRPGWHIECSAMSLGELKIDTLDIHGGGQDLIFPHHENEIAQSEAATGKPFAKYWLHNGFVTINKEKMSKSLGNFFTLKEIYKKYDPQVVRLLLISQHYRSPIDFSESKLEEMSRAQERFTTVLNNMREAVDRMSAAMNINEKRNPPALIAEAEAKFEKAMDDDFNTSEALAVLYELVTATNIALEKTDLDLLEVSYLARTMIKLGKVLGLFPTGGVQPVKADVLKGKDINKTEIESLITQREEARRNKQWSESDRIRDILTAKGIVIEDTAHGTRWKVK
ncbi:MAG: cysteine--tRNA ligase [bacterium]|nr:cysteine--tRNA ligase [bacterium]